MAGYSLFRVWNLAIKSAEVTGIGTGLAGIWQPVERLSTDDITITTGPACGLASLEKLIK